MPKINRIRVNNVKYNFGTQQYDDFVMKMYGKNTIYDLANGGGKSVLMLLLLQNMIPNCTLDEKQPIEKLFRGDSKNTTIHSLIEWELDEKDKKDGYLYLTTGFCAKKAKQSEEEKDTASIDYFNYCIFYRKYNENDIINLPLVNEEGRITYSGLKSYLKELEKNDLSLKVYVFDKKGEYQKFIAEYGLIESQWEIIRGINKTEGHVRTYFENNYKTTRKVVEDLFIEEIIEKAFLNQIDGENVTQDMAQTLMQIKDKLIELTKKKKEISSYDRQQELINVLIARIGTFLEQYREKEESLDGLKRIYHSLESYLKEVEESIEEKNKKLEQIEESNLEQKKKEELLKLNINERQKEELVYERETLLQQKNTVEDKMDALLKDLNKRESVNEYLRYLEDEKERKEQEEILKSFQEGKKGSREEAALYAYNIKLRLDEALSETVEEEKSLAQKQEKIAKELQGLKESEKELELKINLSKHTLSMLSKEEQQWNQKISRLRNELLNPVLGSAKDALKQNEERLRKYQKEATTVKEQESQCQEILLELGVQRETLKKEIKDLYEEKEKLLKEEEEINASLKKQERLKEIYEVKNEKFLKQAILQKITLNQEEIQKLRKKKEGTEEFLRALEQGENPYVGKGAKAVKDYIKTRHGIDAILGMEYLQGLKEEERKLHLEKQPLLPYGVLVEQFSELSMDENLKNLELEEDIVPVFNLEYEKKIRGSFESNYMFFVSKKKEGYGPWNKEEEKLKKQALLGELNESMEEKERQLLTYEEDLKEVLAMKEVSKDSYANRLAEFRTAIEEKEENINRVLEKEKERRLKLLECQKKGQEFGEKLLEGKKEENILLEILALQEDLEEKEKGRKEEQEQILVWNKELEDLQKQLWNLQQDLLKGEEKRNALKEKIKKESEFFEKEVKEYVPKEGDWEILTLVDSVLLAKFSAVKALLNKAEISFEDKKRFIKSLKNSQETSLKRMKKKGFTLETMMQLEKEESLIETREEVLETMERELLELQKEEGQYKTQLAGKDAKISHMEGRIELARNSLQEKFQMEDKEFYQNGSIEELKKQLDSCKEVYEELKKGKNSCKEELAALNRQKEKQEGWFNEAKHYLLMYEVDLQGDAVYEGNSEKMQEDFKAYKKTLEQNQKKTAKAIQEFESYKMQTVDSLKELDAYELAHTIREQVVLPKDLDTAKELMENLDAMKDYIVLEKDRIQKGIVDMEFMKQNFESQCLQRCQDVKMELDRLSKLSRIQLDGQLVQMIQLNIPYVKEELCAQRMSLYIDEIIEQADKKNSQMEVVLYLKGQLSLKKLFSVMVTDMNGIGLYLYKRERIKEQSRFLRYEEAVGSTGQSQGIYIQFLISVIHYIANINSHAKEQNGVSNVIFLDNPFGAAKDVYIWEPIFELLKTNQVQLIVPARGATPAITNRFDVNYVLGQKQVGKVQQTVVVDYRSEVEQERLEYHRLEFEQETFDFV